MTRKISKALALLGALSLGGCLESGPRQLDITKVMDITIDTIVDYTKEVEATGGDTSHPAVIEGFVARLHKALNGRPDPFTNGTLGLKLNDDASFDGFDDLNKNNLQEDNEQRLFTLEIDEENERLIASDFADNVHGTTFRDGQYRGFFFVWVSGRQRAAGLSPNRFSGRDINTRMKPIRTAADTSGRSRRKSGARSRARSGGSRSGK